MFGLRADYLFTPQSTRCQQATRVRFQNAVPSPRPCPPACSKDAAARLEGQGTREIAPECPFSGWTPAEVRYFLVMLERIALLVLLTLALHPSLHAQVSEKVLQRVEIPTVNLQEVSLVQALDFVKQQVAKQTDDKLKLNIVPLLTDEEKEKTITLSLNKIPASALLEYLAQLGNVDIRYDQYAITVLSPEETPTAN